MAGYLVITTVKSQVSVRGKWVTALFYLRATHFFLKSLRNELRKPPFWSGLGFWSLKEVCSLSLSSFGQNRVASSRCISWKDKKGMLFYSFPKNLPWLWDGSLALSLASPTSKTTWGRRKLISQVALCPPLLSIAVINKGHDSKATWERLHFLPGSATV